MIAHDEEVLLRTPESLRRALHDHVNGRAMPAALVFNCHITGLAVARSLGARGVPVIALDKDERGYGLYSRYVAVRGYLPSPLDDEPGFVETLLHLGASLERRAVLFPTNDEWVLGVGRQRRRLERYFEVPFAGEETVARILDKATLYAAAAELGVPIPRTWDLARHDPAALAREMVYPCILKPREQRSFTDQFGVKVFEVTSPEQFLARAALAREHGLLAQEIIPVTPDGFHSLCAYVAPGGEPLGLFVGRKLEQYPPQFGTGCLVDAHAQPELAARGARVLGALDYHGIAEVEFLYDPRDGEHKLLDINTRVWKWIGLPIAAGVDLPWLAYAVATGQPITPTQQSDTPLTWVYLRDYLALRRGGGGGETAAALGDAQWLALIAGRADGAGVVEAVLDPADPQPFYRLLCNEMEGKRYFCAC